MKFKISIFFLLPGFFLSAQKMVTDANLSGHVLADGQHIGYVNIALKGTTIGTITEGTGHYRLINLPTGTFTIVASSVGYKMVEKEITLYKNSTLELNFELEPDVLGLEEVIISSDRNAKKRGKAPVVVNTLSHKTLTSNQVITAGEGLNFLPGMRLESNCQNCGFTQVRMNGMEGTYSQILINNRPVFSGLAGVYGLELIPANIIERIEVVRGGGSALYGSNAIAGTINLVLKDPVRNYFEAAANYGFIGTGMENSGENASDYNLNFNASVVTDDAKTGLSIFSFHRDREAFDANGDEFSELTQINNSSFGARFFHRIGTKSKISVDFLNINEERRGGDQLDKPEHEAWIAESAAHDIKNVTVSLDRFTREQGHISLYASGQTVNRDSYYGAMRSLKDYGRSEGFTYNTGAQYNLETGHLSLVAGIENSGDQLLDIKLGYPDVTNAFLHGESTVIPHTENTIIADQYKNASGIYAQLDAEYNAVSVSAGARFEHYYIRDQLKTTDDPSREKTGNVLSPRISILYNIMPNLKARFSYAQGYRAPQIFDEDLHIESSGSRTVIHKNDPDLKQESSHSITSSLDFNFVHNRTSMEFLAEAFYTRLIDPFANEFSEPDASGVVTYTRINSEGGATVQGINLEADLVFSRYITVKSGATVQKSWYDDPQEFDENKFLRTPDSYGFLTVDLISGKDLGATVTGTYTGPMLVPHFGIDPEEATEQESDAIFRGDVITGSRLEKSGLFFDMGVKLHYTFAINGARMQLLGGVKNLFNAYQQDFDRGIYRDPGYTFGPVQPRTIYMGIRIGNRLLN